ncbi:MAG: hypothetical protein WCP20_23765, partial [Desulfuromonadales bacterium]
KTIRRHMIRIGVVLRIANIAMSYGVTSGGYLAKKWGVKAAVRTWHITRTGTDVEMADPFEKGKATEKSIIWGKKVPCAVLPGDNVYAVSQSLSWLAKERRDVQEQLEWKQQIPELIDKLYK